MWTEEALPDDDLESVYGREALEARISARLGGLGKMIAAQRRHLAAMNRLAVLPPERNLMKSDPYADMFRFRLGDCVRNAEYPTERHYIAQRRWTEREILAPVVEYRLRLGSTSGHMMLWVPDADLTLWVDSEEPEQHRS